MNYNDPAGVMGDIQRKQRFDNSLRTLTGQQTIATPPAARRLQPMAIPQSRPNIFQSLMMRMFGDRARK